MTAHDEDGKAFDYVRTRRQFASSLQHLERLARTNRRVNMHLHNLKPGVEIDKLLRETMSQGFWQSHVHVDMQELNQQKIFIENSESIRFTSVEEIREALENNLRTPDQIEAMGNDPVIKAAVEVTARLAGREFSVKRAPKPIERPPAHRMVSFLERVISKKAFDRYFQPAIADYRQSFYEALQSGDTKEAEKLRRELKGLLAWIAVEWIWTVPMGLVSKFRKGE